MRLDRPQRHAAPTWWSETPRTSASHVLDGPAGVRLKHRRSGRSAWVCREPGTGTAKGACCIPRSSSGGSAHDERARPIGGHLDADRSDPYRHVRWRARHRRPLPHRDPERRPEHDLRFVADERRLGLRRPRRQLARRLWRSAGADRRRARRRRRESRSTSSPRWATRASTRRTMAVPHGRSVGGPSIGLPSITELVIDPTNAQNLYLRAVDAIYRSTDGGASWQLSLRRSGLAPDHGAGQPAGPLRGCADRRRRAHQRRRRELGRADARARADRIRRARRAVSRRRCGDLHAQPCAGADAQRNLAVDRRRRHLGGAVDPERLPFRDQGRRDRRRPPLRRRRRLLPLR